MGFDYAGVDFAIASEGSLLLFEANATMVVHPPRFRLGLPTPYRRQCVRRSKENSPIADRNFGSRMLIYASIKTYGRPRKRQKGTDQVKTGLRCTRSLPPQKLHLSRVFASWIEPAGYNRCMIFLFCIFMK
jgi:hypothetical protein